MCVCETETYREKQCMCFNCQHFKNKEISFKKEESLEKSENLLPVG